VPPPSLNFSAFSMPMLMFDPKKTKSFLHLTAEVVLFWFVVAKGLTAVWENYGVINPPLTWAYTITTGFVVFYLLLYLCMSRQAVYQTRIDECAEAKSKLELAVLKKRQTSKRGAK
jgi:hypothetical protein